MAFIYRNPRLLISHRYLQQQYIKRAWHMKRAHGTARHTCWTRKRIRAPNLCVPDIRCCSAMVPTLGQWNVITRTLIAASRVREWRGLRDGHAVQSQTRDTFACIGKGSRGTLCVGQLLARLCDWDRGGVNRPHTTCVHTHLLMVDYGG